MYHPSAVPSPGAMFGQPPSYHLPPEAHGARMFQPYQAPPVQQPGNRLAPNSVNPAAPPFEAQSAPPVKEPKSCRACGHTNVGLSPFENRPGPSLGQLNGPFETPTIPNCQTSGDRVPAQVVLAGLSKNGAHHHRPNYGYKPNEPTRETTMYHIPTFCATMENPITPERQYQLEHFDPHYSQRVPQQAPNGLMAKAALPAEFRGMINPTKDRDAHECSCGPNCACEFCAVHPFNKTTTRSMEQLSEYMDAENDGEYTSSRPQSSYNEYSPIGDTLSPFTNVPTNISSPSWREITIDPTQMTRNDAHSEMPTIDSSKYYHIEYPMPFMCACPEGDCQCGQT